VPTSAAERPPEFLRIDGVRAGYGQTIVVDGMSAVVGKGEIVAIIGPNGCGKSTLLKAVTGDLPVLDGSVTLEGKDVTNRAREQLVRAGLGFIPQEREVFAALSVRENLLMGGYLLKKSEREPAIERVVESFPALGRLQKATAGRLSGGERKMLAFGRALMMTPRVIMLDEPSAGLAPVVAAELLSEKIPALAATGTSVLLVEQRAVQALEISGWAYVMTSGKVALEDSAARILAREDVGALFLGRATERDRSPGAGASPLSGILTTPGPI
jgi:ABC-type branched-subunit amino acid transport system ATPase component